MERSDLLREELEARRARKSYAVATIVQTDGSTPRSSGKMLVYEDGSSRGTVGGGSIEQLARQDAAAAIRRGKNALRSYDLTGEDSGTGMTCGGQMTLFIEVFRASPLLVVCGGGHVGSSLIRMARPVGFEILLVDDRPEESIAEAVALAERFVQVRDFEAELGALPIEPGAFFVIATHGHACDEEALAAALTKEGAYVGMLGSRKKIGSVFARMREKGFTDEQLSAVYTPIGLDLGGETPEEIAVSILSEILMVKNGRGGGHLSRRE